MGTNKVGLPDVRKRRVSGSATTVDIEQSPAIRLRVYFAGFPQYIYTDPHVALLVCNLHHLHVLNLNSIVNMFVKSLTIAASIASALAIKEAACPSSTNTELGEAVSGETFQTSTISTLGSGCVSLTCVYNSSC